MKLDIAKKWVAALRSGKYKGTKHVLKRYTEKGPRYCCLGVLCEVYAKTFPKGTQNWENDATLPTHIMQWAGMWTNTGTYGNSNTQNLAYQNDKAKRGFKGIANIIERHVKDL